VGSCPAGAAAFIARTRRLRMKLRDAMRPAGGAAAGTTGALLCLRHAAAAAQL